METLRAKRWGRHRGPRRADGAGAAAEVVPWGPGEARSRIEAAVERVGELVLGKEAAVRLALAGLLARGHVLLEDLPGVGKTLLAQTLARVLGLEFRRIQFTSDLLPADVVGVAVYEGDTRSFVFHPGPLFAQVVLADEINRATPKTQSALLEAMEERQVTVDGTTRVLPRPFFVLATQNPRDQFGTFPLPESQLDRFLLRLHLGYPDPASERELLRGRERRELLGRVEPALSSDELLLAQEAVEAVHVSEALLDYVQALLDASRRGGLFPRGLSPRAGVALLRAARAWAFMGGRGWVAPEDVQAVLPAVAGHRLESRAGDPGAGVGALLEAVPVP
ncbi:MAG: AAA family ATPase [Deferrisomatales bacterium]